MPSFRHRPALAVVFCILGFMLAVAFNSKLLNDAARPQHVADLPSVVEDMERQRHALQERLRELRERMAEAERKAAEDSGVRESFSKELQDVRAAAGLTAVTGSGVEVHLGDAAEVPPGGDPNDHLIHDYDISAVVNALMTAGAEAVSVNGQRVVATTPIRCAGTTILVNSTRLGNPYLVLAVGAPEELTRGLLEDPISGPLFDTYKSAYGLQTRIVSQEAVAVPAYMGSMKPVFVKAGGGSS